MASDPFVAPGSVVRDIWGDADAVLLVFAGAAAEFALNRAVDWLFFTGEIPGDPIGRLFRTAAYAQGIVFADYSTARQTFGQIRAAHAAVEGSRGDRIPDWAHRDVLYMLIDYSERAGALLRGAALTPIERGDLYEVFRRVGEGLAIPLLPATYAEWRADRELHMRRDLSYSSYTAALYERYRAQLGPWRYRLLLRLQSMLVPPVVAELLRLRRTWWVPAAVGAYRALRRLRLAALARVALIPTAHAAQVAQLGRRSLGAGGGLRSERSGVR